MAWYGRSVATGTATWVSRFGRAVALSVAAYVAVAVGWLFLMVALFSDSQFWGRGLATASPWYGPDEMSEHVPRRKTLTLPTGRMEEAPHFQTRNLGSGAWLGSAGAGVLLIGVARVWQAAMGGAGARMAAPAVAPPAA